MNPAVPKSELEEVAETMVKELVTKSPAAVKRIKKLVHRGIQTNLESGLDLEYEEVMSHFESEAAKEGVSAFLHKRKLVFKGKWPD